MSIEETIAKYVKLSKSGRSLIGLCPFHKEKSPSFTVDTVKQAYLCFGCSAGGDVSDFMRRIDAAKR